jgi:hypothetical protein
MFEVVDFKKNQEEIERKAKQQKWKSDEARLRFLIQGHKYEGIYLNMLEEYGSSMAETLEERFKEYCKSN